MCRCVQPVVAVHCYPAQHHQTRAAGRQRDVASSALGRPQVNIGLRSATNVILLSSMGVQHRAIHMGHARHLAPFARAVGGAAKHIAGAGGLAHHIWFNYRHKRRTDMHSRRSCVFGPGRCRSHASRLLRDCEEW